MSPPQLTANLVVHVSDSKSLPHSGTKAQLAPAMGYAELPLGSTAASSTRVTTFQRLALAMLSIAQQRLRIDDGNPASANGALVPLPKWLQATKGEESDVPGVSNFNLVAKSDAPWVLQLGSLIRYLEESEEYVDIRLPVTSPQQLT